MAEQIAQHAGRDFGPRREQSFATHTVPQIQAALDGGVVNVVQRDFLPEPAWLFRRAFDMSGCGLHCLAHNPIADKIGHKR
jgi:hypothetical protein